MNVFIHRGVAEGILKAPPSKSIAHRMLICAALTEGVSSVKGIAMSDDIKATLGCLKELGAEWSYDGENVTVGHADVTRLGGKHTLDCNESGSTLRFFIPLCMLGDAEVKLIGSERLMSRPLGVYRDICEKNGIFFEQNKHSVTVRGRLCPGEYKVPGDISSQFISGLLFALPLLEGDSIIKLTGGIESRSYIDLTLNALRQSGINVHWLDEKSIFVGGRGAYSLTEAEVEGDHSNAAFLSALSYLGGNVKVTGLNENSAQGDRVYKELFDKLSECEAEIDISDCPDLGPILFAFAAAKHGALFTGTRRLKIKESDRAAAMAEELCKFGARLELSDDTVRVLPSVLHSPEEPICGHNDHRIVMSAATLLTLFGGEIRGAEAVKKSFPDYFEMLASVGIEVDKYEA